MPPTFEQFVAALRDASARPGIGLVIDDADAAALLTRRDWAMDYFHQWLAMFPAATAVAPAVCAADPAGTPTAAPAATAAVAPAAVVSRDRTPFVVAGSVLAAVVLAILTVVGLTAASDALLR